VSARPRFRLAARTKILLILSLVVVCVSTPADRFPAFAGYLAFLLGFAGLTRVRLQPVIRHTLAVLPFLLMIAVLIPFLPEPPAAGVPGPGWSAWGGWVHLSHHQLLVLWNSLIKAWTGAFALVILSASTPFPELLHGLEHLRFPRLLLAILAVTHRYALVFADEFSRTRRALAARNFEARWLWQTGTLGRLIGSFFLRAYERGERVYLAMLARGFSGVFPIGPHPAHSKDLAVLIGAGLILAGLRWGAA
jgi:cobalt/nickel transport system permease protein